MAAEKTEKVDGAAWLLGRAGPQQKATVSPRIKAEKLEPHETEAVIRMFGDAAGAGKALVGGLDGASEALQQIIRCGLTPEALVILVTEKCPRDRAGRPTTTDTVERVLQGLFRLPEYLSR